MEFQSWFARSNRFSKIFVVAAAYYILGKIGLLLAIPPGVATAVWLPSGLALAAVLFGGYQVWTGIWIGSFLVNIATLYDRTGAGSALASVFVVSGIAAGSALQAVLGAYLIENAVGSTHPFDKVKNVIKFAGLVTLSCVVAPTIGSTGLLLGNFISGSGYPMTWLTWWLGDLVGVLIVVPLLSISEKELRSHWWDRRRLLEGSLLLVLLFAVSQITVLGSYLNFAVDPSAYITIPFVLLAAFRFGQVGVVASVLMILSTAIFGISRGFGPFVHESFNQSLLSLQLYIGIILVTGLIVAAALTERRYIERCLTLQYWVARILTQAGTLKEAVGEILQAVCGELGWQYGGLWRLDEETGALRCVTTWHVPSVRFPKFEDASLKATFAPGTGLPGRVLKSGQSAWIVDLGRDANFPRGPLAIKEGLRSACAFPILRDGNTIGVIEFFSLYEKQPDTGMLNLLASIGDKISRFMEYRRNVEVMLESETRKRAVIESALDCIITFNQSGEIIEFNPTAEKTFGYSREEMIGKRMDEIIMPEGLNEGRPRLQDYLAWENGALLNRRIEMQALRSNGTEFPAELSITRFFIESRVLFTAFLRDISEQKRAEETIRVLSTPVLKVRRGLLILPLIGSMDKKRVDHLREQLLSGVRSHRAKVVVVDITGIAFVDVESVKQILDIVAAARLMGAQVILTGMSRSFSEALLSANINLDMMISVGDLQRGIEEAERIMNMDEMITLGSWRVHD